MGRTVVLILNWNGKTITLDCVRSFLAIGVAAEDLLVVDNGSTDGSPEAIRKQFPDVLQLVLPTNLGYTGGNNRGFEWIQKQAKWEFVLIQNNDTLAQPGLVGLLEAALDARPRAAMAQPKLLFFDGRTIENAGFLMDRYGVTLPRGRGEAREASFEAEGFFYASGACALTRLSTLRDVGGFDEAYFGYHEDVDLSWRIRLAGHDVVYVDGATCWHDESRTAGHAPTKIGVIWRNRLRTLLKNNRAGRLSWLLPTTLVLMGGYSLGSAVAQRRFAFVSLYFSAIGWNIRKWPDTMRERRRVQALRRVDDGVIARHAARGSIEWKLSMEGIRKRRG